MREFIGAFIIAGVLAITGAIALNTVQKPAQVAFSTESVRL